MIKLEFYVENEINQKRLDTYQLADFHFTLTPAAAVKAATTDDQWHPVMILVDDQLVGFFVLLTNEAVRYTGHDIVTTVVLRALSVDDRYRGKGIAKQAFTKLPALVAHHFPAATKIILCVDPTNKIARGLYTKMGYKNTGKTIIYHEELLMILQLQLVK